MTPEFSRPVRIDTLGGEQRALSIEAGEAERAALAARFGIVAIESLTAQAALRRDRDVVVAEGRLAAKVVQSCVATDAPVPAEVEEAFHIEFRPQPVRSGVEEEIELSEAELDVVFYDGASIDLGEAVAETLSLSLDPYPRAADAERFLKEAGVRSEADMEEERNARSPFAALRGLSGEAE